LNLDNLLGQHLRLGVDAYYSYGLLRVWIQHLLFRVFGAGYGALLGCTVVTIALIALFWALLLRQLPAERKWLLTIVALCPIVIWGKFKSSVLARPTFDGVRALAGAGKPSIGRVRSFDGRMLECFLTDVGAQLIRVLPRHPTRIPFPSKCLAGGAPSQFLLAPQLIHPNNSL